MSDFPDLVHDYREFLESAPDGVIAVTPDGRIVFVNAQIERLFGYLRDEIIGQNVETLMPDRFREAHLGFLETCAQDPGARYASVGLDLVGRRKNGGDVFVEISLSPFHSSGQSLVRATVRDLSERRRLEDQLRQAQKMEAVGRLAGGIAHDFNNLLTVISGSVDLALERLDDGNPVRDDLDAIRHAAQRAADLTRQLLAFSRRQIITPTTMDLNQAVRGAEGMLRRLIGVNIDLAVNLEPSLWRVKADPGQVEQVIVNLAVNARDAMPRGGSLTLETRNVDLDQVAAATAAIPHGPHVALAILDTGVGIDRETIPHLFEPFFTTKGPARGTGLGLATVYGIVKQNGGEIAVSSEVGRGTTFTIYLPRVDEAIESPAGGARRASTHGTETVLVVEDEQGVRELVRRVLEQNGYAVLIASEGQAAVDLARHHPSTIDLLVTDVVIPEMNGREVAEAVTSLRPGIRVLYISGYSSNAIVRQGLLDPGFAFLEKPFAPTALASKVREVLDGA